MFSSISYNNYIRYTLLYVNMAEYHTDCNEAYIQGETCSGVYTIKPDNYPPFDVRQSLFFVLHSWL